MGNTRSLPCNRIVFKPPIRIALPPCFRMKARRCWIISSCLLAWPCLWFGCATGKPHVSAWLLPDSGNTLEREIRKFREQLAGRDLNYRTSARRLFDRLLAPAMTELKSATEWIVSPDGALWEVPFQALVDPAGRHVLETRAVSVTPSLTAAARLRATPHPPASDAIPLLAMGNPLPAGAPLPDAAQEVERIGAGFQVRHGGGVDW